MAKQVRPRLTQPNGATGHQQSAEVIGRQPAYSIRARDPASHTQAGCMAAISTCNPDPTKVLGNKGRPCMALPAMPARSATRARRARRPAGSRECPAPDAIDCYRRQAAGRSRRLVPAPCSRGVGDPDHGAAEALPRGAEITFVANQRASARRALSSGTLAEQLSVLRAESARVPEAVFESDRLHSGSPVSGTGLAQVPSYLVESQATQKSPVPCPAPGGTRDSTCVAAHHTRGTSR